MDMTDTVIDMSVVNELLELGFFAFCLLFVFFVDVVHDSIIEKSSGGAHWVNHP